MLIKFKSKKYRLLIKSDKWQLNPVMALRIVWLVAIVML